MYSIDNRQRTRVANVIGVNFNFKPHWYNVKGIVETGRGKFAIAANFFHSLFYHYTQSPKTHFENTLIQKLNHIY